MPAGVLALRARRDPDRSLLRKWLGVAPTPEGRERQLGCRSVVLRPVPSGRAGEPSRVQLGAPGGSRPGWLRQTATIYSLPGVTCG